jgi:hypothetical protein
MNSPVIPIDPGPQADPGQQDLSAELATSSGDYLTQVDVNHVLGNLFTLLAANRISSKRAATLAHICATILKSQEGMHDQVQFLNWTAYDFLTKALQEHYGLPQTPGRNLRLSPELADPAIETCLAKAASVAPEIPAISGKPKKTRCQTPLTPLFPLDTENSLASPFSP